MVGVVVAASAVGTTSCTKLSNAQIRENRSVATLELTPISSDEGAAIRVLERLPAAVITSQREFVLSFATMGPAYQRTTDTVKDLRAEDELGPLPLTGPILEGDEDTWRPARKIHGTVLLRYVVPAAPANLPHHGPITYLQSTGGGLSGAFGSFLLAPRWNNPLSIAVRWHLPAGQMAVSNVQIGNVERRVTFSSLADTLFVAGPLIYAPATLSDHTLVVAGLARPQSEVDGARQWFSSAFSAMRRAFGSSVDGYRIMFFSHDRQAFDSGTSRAGGFLYFVPAGRHLDDEQNHATIAHEMVHSFVAEYQPGTDGPGDWYNEGIADYAAIVVPNAAGLYTPRELLEVVNKEAAAYYLNPLRQVPLDRFDKIKWVTPGAWSLGYTRGAIYFANLDAGLRAQGARTTVLALIQEMNRMASANLGPADWERLLSRSAGSWAVTQWRAMLAGQIQVPVDGTFSACFVPRRIFEGHYDLGFMHNGLQKGDHVGMVQRGSNADRAGLRDGDILREQLVEYGISNSFDAQVTVKVLRDGKPLDITYLPRSGAEPAYRWFPKSGNPDHPCGN